MPKAGELWLAEIPFTSGMASKRRPVLVLWEDNRILSLIMILWFDFRCQIGVRLCCV
jgi:mRNA-degrading endonuclease toxin of MazEF toxin-antitoxin module